MAKEKEENVEVTEEVKVTEKKKSKVPFIVLTILLVVGLVVGVIVFIAISVGNLKGDEGEVVPGDYAAYKIVDNSLGEFDIRFVQLENKKENMIYSPLSIKYALVMLNEGADGNTKEQINNILGDYNPTKYKNSENMTFANALFIKDSYKNNVKAGYVDTLGTKYNANIIYDSFKTPDKVNNWVKKNTFGLIDNVTDDVSTMDFLLTNALAIDMEWVNKIQSVEDIYYINYEHRDYSFIVDALSSSDYSQLEFEGVPYKVQSVKIGAVANRYNLVEEVGEDNIRKTVGDEYKKWLKTDEATYYSEYEELLGVDEYLDQYIREIGRGYNQASSSTDFTFYVDDNVKVFAKDLKDYNGTTLQYVGIMPVKESLDSYVKDVKASDINTLISNLKPIELNSFKDGVVTEVSGSIPVFNFEYELDLMADLKSLGVVDVFDSKKANLSKLASGKPYINEVVHKTNIEFSNDGIKAAAVTAAGGYGAAGGGFDYIYEVPVEKIDLTFDNPYLFFIRDKKTGEVWFTGTVYEPAKWEPSLDYGY